MIKNFWNNLTISQKYYLGAGLMIICGAMIFQFVISPFFEAKERIQRSLTTNEKTLVELKRLGAEYRLLKQKSLEVQQVLSQRPRDFTLFSYLEKKAGEAGVKAGIKYMNPLKGKTVGPHEETAVDIQLEKMTLRELTNFLYLVESPHELIKINKISIQKMKESPEYLTALIQVVTYKTLIDEMLTLTTDRK
ncbi:MAG: type II secretion system protein M [Deltaproteobacteria bacterium]|nr:type II secretion system protein M [Deltaproteobacteria bacterium]